MKPFIRGLAALAVLCAGAAGAQQAAVLNPTQVLDFNAPESWALKYTASETLFTGFSAPMLTHFGQVTLGVEAGILPTLSERQRTVGFNGTKTEDLNKLPVLVRPRVTLGLPADFSLAVGYVPPLNVHGAQPDLVSFSLGRPMLTAAGNAFRLGIRGYGQVGNVVGDFTCSAKEVAAGNDPTLNPFGCTQPSQDEADLRYAGLELSGAYRIDALHGLEPHLAIAGNYMDLAFNVHAQYQGIDDNTRLVTHGFTFSSNGGFGLPLGWGLRMDLDAFYSPLLVQRPDDIRRVQGLFNARALFQYTLF